MAYQPDPFKLGAVGGFINANFPGPEFHVEGTWAWDREAQVFRIHHGGHLRHIFGVSREFFDDHSLGQIEALLGETLLEQIKHRGPEKMTVLTSGGIGEIEP